MKRSNRKEPLCVTCCNYACSDRCNPSQCENYCRFLNRKLNKQTQLEQIVMNAEIKFLPANLFSIKQSLENSDQYESDSEH